MKQAKRSTRAYKIGYDCATKNLPNNNPYATGSTRYDDFNRGYEERVKLCKNAGQWHPALEEPSDA